MKQAIMFAAIMAASYTSFARPVGNSIPTNKTYNDSSSVITQQMLSEIMDVVGLQQSFELKEAKVLNIEATISHGKRCILYNPDFISWVTRVTRSKWAALALLAHEVGHHLNGHTLKKGGSKPELELEADAFAGFILHKLGASLEESQEVMKYIARPETTATHPARASRMLAIENGWNKATGNASTANVAKTASPKGGAN